MAVDGAGARLDIGNEEPKELAIVSKLEPGGLGVPFRSWPLGASGRRGSMVWLKEKLGVWSILTSRNEMKVVIMVKMIINKWAALKTCNASFMVPTSCKHQMPVALTARTTIWNFRWALNPTMRPPEPFTFSFNLLFHQNEKIPSISPSFAKGTIEEKQACSTS